MNNFPKFVKVKLEGGGSYIQRVYELNNMLQGELDGAEIGQTITLHLTPVAMTEEEYRQLPDFEGH